MRIGGERPVYFFANVRTAGLGIHELLVQSRPGSIISLMKTYL